MDVNSVQLRPGRGSSGERRLAALRAAGLLGAPVEERFDRLTRLARRLLGVPVALVSLLDADRQFFLSAQGLPEPWASLRETPLSHSFCRSVVEAGLSLTVNDAREDSRVRGNPAIGDLGVVAYLAVPLALPDGCVVGALCAIDREPRAWAVADEEVMTDLAGAVMGEMAASLRLREAEAAAAALRESEARYRALFEVSPQMVWFTDAEGRCTHVNRYYTDFACLPAERALGDGWLAAVHPHDRAGARAAWTGAVAGGGEYEVEYRIRRGADGSHRWFLVRGAPLRGAGGRVERWIGVGVDIDDRRRAEEALRRRSRKLELLSEAAAGLLSAGDPDEVLRPLFRSLAEEFGLDISFSFVVDEGGDGLRLASCSGVPEEAGAGLARLAFGQAVCGTVAQTRRAVCVADVQASGDPKLRLVKGLGVRAYACFPLLAAGDRPLGTLFFGSRRRDRLSEGDFAFLRTIARYVAVVRERLRAEAALRASEARLQLALEAGGLAFWELDPATGAVLRAAFHDAIFGYETPLPEWSYEAFLGHVVPEDRAEVERAYQAALEGELAATLECRIRRADDGAVRWLELHGRAQRDAGGRVVRLHGVLRDVSERKGTEAALRASEERFRRAMGIGTVGVLFFCLDGRITDANAAFERMSGYTRDELLALEDWKVLTPPEFGEATARAMAELAGHGETAHYEKQMVRKDGLRWWGLFAPTRLSGAGRASRCVEFVVDITERKSAEAALRASEARQRELQAELLHVSRLSAAGEMAAALAHELNQPLTAAATAVQAARRTLASASPGCLGGQPGEVREAMDLAAEQARRAGQIVRRLRDFVARGEAEPRLESVPRLVEEAATLALVGAKERGVAVELRLEPGLPAVLADRIQIEQVLFNLMRNALEAMDDGGAPAGGGGAGAPRYRELVVAAGAADPGTVEVAVADTGPGLAPEVAGRLFEPFVSTKPEGMGVGLSICRTIVEAHGGRLWAEPNPGGGAVFRFTLPAAPSGAATG